MKKFVLTVDEKLKCSTVSSTAKLVMSPRGSIYFPGNRLRRDEEDITIDSYSGTISRKSKVELILDANNNAFNLSKQLDNPTQNFSIDPPDAQRKITTFDALQNRYTHLIEQCSFNFSGSVDIEIEVCEPKGLTGEKRMQTIKINSSADFQQVLDYIIESRPASCDSLDIEQELANMERCYSALKL